MSSEKTKRTVTEPVSPGAFKPKAKPVHRRCLANMLRAFGMFIVDQGAAILANGTGIALLCAGIIAIFVNTMQLASDMDFVVRPFVFLFAGIITLALSFASWMVLARFLALSFMEAVDDLDENG